MASKGAGFEKSTSASSSCKPEQKAHERATSELYLASPPPRWSREDFISRTPSRADGITERAERVARMSICERARDIVRGFLGFGSTASPALELSRLRAQALACHYAQMYLMSASLCSEDGDVVALAASLCGLKALNVICFADDLLRVFNEQRRALGEPELPEDEVDLEQIEEVEVRMARLTASEFGLGGDRPSVPLDLVDSFVDALVKQLPQSQAFSSSCHRQLPARAAQKMAPRLKEVARCFAVDAMLGPAAITQRPDVIARVVAAMSVRYLLQQLGTEVTGSELMDFVAQDDACRKGTGHEELRCATREVFGTYRLWQEELCAMNSAVAGA